MSPHELHLWQRFADTYKKWEWANRTDQSFFDKEDLFKLYVSARDVYEDYVYLGKIDPSTCAAS